MPRIIPFLASLAIAVLFSAAPTAGHAAGKEPSDVVQRFQSALLDVMKEAEALTVASRYDRLAPVVDSSFHLPLMMYIILGERWRDTSEDERASLVAAFRRMSVTTLATLFDGYSGETFEVIGEREGPQNTRLVETHLNRPDDSPVDIAYITRKAEDGWRIIDVIVDKGISELSVRRSEYRRILADGGVPALTSALNDKADNLIAER